jgi:hypothetical protein
VVAQSTLFNRFAGLIFFLGFLCFSLTGGHNVGIMYCTRSVSDVLADKRKRQLNPTTPNFKYLSKVLWCPMAV